MFSDVSEESIDSIFRMTDSDAGGQWRNLSNKYIGYIESLERMLANQSCEWGRCNTVCSDLT
jgi:hypothetical protein